LSGAGRRLLVGFKIGSKSGLLPHGLCLWVYCIGKGRECKVENGRLGCFAGKTMENHGKHPKTTQNYGKLEKGVWVFLFITTIKKKKN
jgi:hypothetical protein